MVDSISGKSNPIQDNGLLNVDRQQSVEKNNLESASENKSANVLKLLDEATISDEAKNAYEKDKEVMRFSRLAQRIKAPFDSEKVASIKNMLDSGRINEYLRTINTEDLAQSLLNAPGSAFLH
jgi:hypothetical protein